MTAAARALAERLAGPGAPGWIADAGLSPEDRRRLERWRSRSGGRWVTLARGAQAVWQTTRVGLVALRAEIAREAAT